MGQSRTRGTQPGDPPGPGSPEDTNGGGAYQGLGGTYWAMLGTRSGSAPQEGAEEEGRSRSPLCWRQGGS